MAYAKKFEDLDIFQQARQLCKDVYAITKDGEFHKDTRFVQQIHAAAGSVMDNRRTKQAQSQARLSYALQEGGRP